MKRLLAIGICLLAPRAAPAQFAAPNPLAAALNAAAAAEQPRVHPAVVRIVAPGNGSISYGSGTLVYVGDQVGLVITNWHVINEATSPISVHFPDGFYSIGTLQKMDRDWDLAVLAIRKPNVPGVPIAAAPPRPGEMLTIAGYGSGNYRAASGPCTQYVAPGTAFPFEMIECAVSARQGDSGGPIFNSRGELAGVLFGEGQGRTAGSYCGRVRWFLSSVVPELRGSPSMIAAAPLKPIPPRSDGIAPRLEPVGPDPGRAESVRVAAAPVAQSTASPVRFSADAGSQPAVPPIVASTRAAGTTPGTSQTIGWEDLAGATVGEQIKTVLAAIGVLAVLLHALRWMSTERAAA